MLNRWRRALTLVCLLALGACGGAEKKITVSAEEQAKAKADVEEWVKAGVVTQYSCENLTAQMLPKAWLTFNANAKQGVTLRLAEACFTPSRGFRMTIIDSQSGKRLARVGAWGYSVD